MKYAIITTQTNNCRRLQSEIVDKTWTEVLKHIEDEYHISHRQKLEDTLRPNYFRGDGDLWPDVIVVPLPPSTKTDADVEHDFGFDEDEEKGSIRASIKKDLFLDYLRIYHIASTEFERNGSGRTLGEFRALMCNMFATLFEVDFE